jgi:hypothetical protein
MGGATGKRRRRWPRILAIIVGFTVLSSVYSCGVDLYRAAQHGPKPFIKNAKVPEDHMEAHVRTLSIDPNKADLVLRVEARPSGVLAGPDSLSIARPVRIDLVGALGTASYRYEPGDHISPIDVTVGMTGDPNSYPFDSYRAPVEVRVAALSSPTSDPSEVTSPYPTRMVFDGTLSGYSVKARRAAIPAGVDPKLTENVLSLDLSITRARVTSAFAVIILVLMVLLAGSAVALAVTVTARHRRVEIAMLTWLAALLFATVPLRNAMPGAPPIGALIDVLVFFWAVTLIALSLVTVLVTWIRQRSSVAGSI